MKTQEVLENLEWKDLLIQRKTAIPLFLKEEMKVAFKRDRQFYVNDENSTIEADYEIEFIFNKDLF